MKKHSSPTVRISLSEQWTLAGRNSLLKPVSVGAFAPPNMIRRDREIELIDQIVLQQGAEKRRAAFAGDRRTSYSRRNCCSIAARSTERASLRCSVAFSRSAL